MTDYPGYDYTQSIANVKAAIALNLQRGNLAAAASQQAGLARMEAAQALEDLGVQLAQAQAQAAPAVPGWVLPAAGIAVGVGVLLWS